jgi:IS1 transposase
VKGNGRTYFTDDWPVYRAVLPEAQHVIGRLGTQTVERDNANTRHYSARMARRTKVVSKSLTMVDLSIKLGIVFGTLTSTLNGRQSFYQYSRNTLISKYVTLS